MRAASKRIDQVNEWLNVGGAIPPEEYERFVESGIGYVIDLREEDIPGVERLEELGIERLQVPVPNGSAPSDEQLRSVARWYDEAGKDAPLYVHCAGGFGRAGTMAIALLINSG